MERFSSGDRYNHDEDENRDSRKNRPLRNITSIYGKSTDQPTSSAQEPSNYGEELAQRWCNSLFYGQSDAPGHGSYEHEGKYVDHAKREIVEPQAESSWAGLLRRWLFKRQSDTPRHGSHEYEDEYIDHAKREIAKSQVESWENRSFNGQFDTPEYGSHEPEGRYTAVPKSRSLRTKVLTGRYRDQSF